MDENRGTPNTAAPLSAEQRRRFYLYGGGISTITGITTLLYGYWSIPGSTKLGSAILTGMGSPLAITGLAFLSVSLDAAIAKHYRHQNHEMSILTTFGALSLIAMLGGIGLAWQWGFGTPTQSWIIRQLAISGGTAWGPVALAGPTICAQAECRVA